MTDPRHRRMHRRSTSLKSALLVLPLLAWMVPVLTAAEQDIEPAQDQQEEQEQQRPVAALYITGGGWHDYPGQRRIITEGLAERLNITFEVDITAGERTDFAIERFKQDNWWDGFDVVIYNMCFSNVRDVDYIERLCRQHREHGIHAIFMHCAIHTFRSSDTNEWYRFAGLRSHRHERQRPFTVEPLQPDHPAMQDFPESWRTPQGELYEIVEVYDTATPLAHAFGEDTRKHHVTIWVNQYGSARVFGTTIGHHNETMAHPVYLDLIARGARWVVAGEGE